MINPKELRIGNYLKRRYSILCLVAINTQIIRAGASGYESDYLTTDDQIEGIELTPEILETCGFKYRNINGQKYYWNVNLPYNALIRDEEDSKIAYNLFYYWGGIEQDLLPGNLKYLHQLQNLFFCLTGEELTYTP